jgi:hypothetical protein
MRPVLLACLALATLTLAACSTRAPSQTADACMIMQENRSWHRATQRTESRWGISPGTQLAFVRQESSFVRNARPPRRKMLGFIPRGRPSTARGYSQALDTTWSWYQRDTGRRGASRTNFADSVDFIGWYASKSRQISGIGLDDPRNLYFAYHEGHGGYNRGTHHSKGWLQTVATQVEANARRYDGQLAQCRTGRRWRG